MSWGYLSQNEQCHSQTVGHRKGYDETAFHKMWHVHSLAVGHRKRCDETAFPKIGVMSLTSCWSWEKMWWECLLENVKYHSLAGGHRKGCDETAFQKMCNVAHTLMVIEKDVMRLLFRKSYVQCCSLPVCDEIAFHKTCNLTHFLFVMRLIFTNEQSHSLPVS